MFPKGLLALTFFAALAVMLPCVLRAQWQPTNGLYGGGFSSVVENEGVLFGEFSYGMFRLTDDGITWSPANRNLPNVTIWGLVSDGTHVFLGSDRIYMWSDDSMAWVPRTPFGESELAYPLGTFRNILYAGNGPVYRSEDEGLSWTKIESDILSNSVAFCLAAVDSFIFIEGQNGDGDSCELFRSSDSGNHWTELDSGTTLVWCLTTLGKNLFAGSSQGVLRSTDYGVTWDTCDNGLPRQLIRTIAIHGSTLAVHAGQGVYVSNDSGVSWQTQSEGFFDGEITAMTFAGDTLVIGTGIGNYLLVDTGRTWISSNNFISVGASDLFVQDSIIFAGDFYRSTDSGLNWSFPITKVSSDSGYYFGNNSIVSQGRNIYAASYGVFLSTDNGVTWTSRSNGLPYSNTQPNINCLAVKGSKIFAGSEYDGIFVSTDSGVTWTAANNGLPLNPPVNALCIAGNDIVAGLNTGSGGTSSVFFSSDDGQTWSSYLDGPDQSFDNCSLVASVDDTTIYAEVDNSLYRSNLHDASWTKLPVGASSFVSIDTMIFVSTGGGIFESFDNGDNWIEVDSGITYTDILSLAVCDSMLFAGTSYYEGTNYPSIPTIWRRPLSEMSTSPYILGASADTINFGNIRVGTDGLRTATVTNDGKSAITIQSFQLTPSQGVFSTSDLSSEVELDPGESFTFEVFFMPTQAGDFTANILVVSEAKAINIILIGSAGVDDVEQLSPPDSTLTIAPNPFSQSTQITFTSPSAGYAEVSIVNMLGVEVARLFSGELGAGEHSFAWDSQAGSQVPQGTYECLVRMNGQVETLPVVLMR